MKIDGLRHPKTKELAHALGVDLPHAIGLLELMWAFAAQQTPQGNIGRWSNAVIADESGWAGCPDLFVNSLISVNFLDESESHRLLVHDWSEHAPNWLRAKLKKLNKTFLSSDLSSDLSTATARTIDPTTSLDKPSQAKTDKTSCESTNVDSRAESVPVKKIIDLYHRTCSQNPRAVKVTPARAQIIKSRWRNELTSLEDWERYFTAVSQSAFLTGRVPANGSRSKPFIADIDFLTKQGNVVKVMEGKYDD